uniref:Uncharacterized protein n=1 Tax=Oryza sativa subsp. japonica TaxID=39947 RepID=Q6K2A7_ORYSJ|nr:hypothetical protein [Oryza sativa Japonica Group]BAD22481.1 hypothetical protein [Oryza sativa Japonica Group]
MDAPASRETTTTTEDQASDGVPVGGRPPPNFLPPFITRTRIARRTRGGQLADFPAPGEERNSQKQRIKLRNTRLRLMREPGLSLRAGRGVCVCVWAGGGVGIGRPHARSTGEEMGERGRGRERGGGESRPAAAPRRWRRGEERRGGAAAQGAWSDGREWTVEMDRDPERIRPCCLLQLHCSKAMSSRGGGDSGGGLTGGRRPLVQQGHEQDAFAAARLSQRAQCSTLRCHCGGRLGFAKVRGEASMTPCLTRLRPLGEGLGAKQGESPRG